ncbi:MAG TPA: alpha/beta hydrolase, partial [Actinomycetaceae bacterium]|nr:alpha/beta hydrolase [Actinomycetaceae bacterium]
MSRIPRALAALLAVTALVACDATGPEGGPAATAPAERAQDALPEVPAELATYYEQELAWEDCGAGMDCTDVTVPMDYDNPEGASITIAVKRRAASGGEPMGSLFLNPGGPGGSGVDLVADISLLLSPDLLDGYDVVGFDPRGVGSSTAVECVSDAELDQLRAEDFETTGDGLTAFADSAERLAAACAEHTGELLGHVDTE